MCAKRNHRCAKRKNTAGHEAAAVFSMTIKEGMRFRAQ